MKAIILAGGEGTRLRPLTLNTPKPAVPVVDRPFLRHQIDLLVAAGIHDVLFCVAYKPERIQAIVGSGEAWGAKIKYVVEEVPLGTGGAVKNAEAELDGTTVVLNGDVLTDVKLSEVLDGHRRSGASATLVLTPVENPSAYGLVQTEPSGRVVRFIEKPGPSEVTTNTINAGIYVLETPSLSLMPRGVNVSIERSFFPSLIARGDLVRAHTHRGYWIDIGTPDKYLQVHRDILRGRFPVRLEAEPRDGGYVHPKARLDPDALLEGPFFVGPGCHLEAGARVGPDATLVSDIRIAKNATVRDAVLWRGSEIGESARIEGAVLGPSCRVGRSAWIGPGSVLGEGAVLPDFSRVSGGPS